MTDNGKSTAASPRLCHVIKVPDFDGYGFNLHAEKGKPGQYIGKVDEASPAELAGLRQGDRIIEVNGANIGRETHKEVVQRIKAIANEVQLLVVDASVTVSKDNRIVDVVTPAAAQRNGSAEPEAPAAATFVPPPPPRDTLQPLQAPDIVVQLPSTPSSPHSISNSRHEQSVQSMAADTVDHAVAAAAVHVAAVTEQQHKQNGQHQQSDDLDIVPITIRADAPANASGNASASANTSTFSTSPKEHSRTSLPQSNGNGGKFISTASFITGEQEDQSSVVSVVSTTVTTTTTEHQEHQEQQQHHQQHSVATATRTNTVTSSASSASASAPPSPSATTVSASSATSTVVATPTTTPTASQSSHSAAIIVGNSHSQSDDISNSVLNHSPPAALPPLMAPAAPKVPEPTAKSASGLNLNMTVAELRAKLAAKKKFDPKNDAVDLRKKFEIVEKL